MTYIAYPDLRRKLENWLILEFFFIHCKIVKVIQDEKIRMKTWFTSVFLMNGTELRSFSDFQIFTWIAYLDLIWNLQNWPILKFVFIHCKTVNVSQDDQIRISTWFTSVFLMNGTELRSLVIFKFWQKSQNRTLVEIFKLTNFCVCLNSL